MTRSRCLCIVVLIVSITPAAARSQPMRGMIMPGVSSTPTPSPNMPGMAMPVPRATATPAPRDVTKPSRASGSDEPAPTATVPVVPLTSHPNWAPPVEDDPHFTYILADQLEYSRAGNGATGVRFDGFGWSGGDIKRLWLKSEGFASSTSGTSEGELSLLYGRLVRPFFDLQAGVRFVPGFGTGPSRAYAVVGFQGLAPYNFDIEPSLFISQSGRISLRFTGSYDIPFTQRLILQPRLESNIALQQDEAVRIGSGFNDIDLGLRLRYEIRREFAPYIGVTWLQRFGQTHAFALREGTDRAQFPLVAGVRFWF